MECQGERTRLSQTSRFQTSGLLSFLLQPQHTGLITLHRFWYTKLQALTSARDFEGLDAFAKSKRSPIGYQPFVHHLVEKGYPKEAAGYVARCDASKRVDLYVECGEWRMAGEECKDRGDKKKIE